MRRLILIIVTLLLIGCSSTKVYASDSDWDISDKLLFTGLLEFSAVDCLQTRYIFKHPNEYREIDSMMLRWTDTFGPDSVPFFFAAKIAATYVVTDDMPGWLRKLTLGFLTYKAFRYCKGNSEIGIGFCWSIK